MNRPPAVAGRFYPAGKTALQSDLRARTDSDAEKIPAFGIIVPHAGYMYSGNVAGSVYSRIEIPDTVILLGPNHTGIGPAISVMTEGTWTSPLGDVEIDSELADSICSASPLLQANDSSHQQEHSLETQLPFLQYFSSSFRIVPICFMRTSWQDCLQVADAILTGMGERKVLIVASSDMTHYESHERAKAKDRMAIEKILALDPEALFQTVSREKISMCGVVPASIMLLCAKKRGIRFSKLIRYQTSGEVSHDWKQVVGYAGMMVY
ncbi:MAG: AmmeMemoRadiSam system protein B [Nitrospinae bacterium CG11_big_fil_rev_8_21_14_0_20_45_15]|nr:MAG: AmmeMemoRadiSam system protein B [Nitrospinae bacterium CG11_big_fil_rev_8_21_14_0_20_45_15]